MKNNPNFIAPVGPASSGKGYLIDALVARGYERISLSDFIRDDLDKLNPGRNHSRSDFQDLGDRKRKKFGNDYWARRAGEQITKMIRSGKTKFAIDSIRNPAELEWFKKAFGLIAIAIDAPLESRIKWAIKRRKGLDEAESDENIRRVFERDLGVDQPEYGQNVSGCLAMADQLIMNDGTLDDLGKKIETALLYVGVEGKAQSPRKEISF